MRTLAVNHKLLPILGLSVLLAATALAGVSVKTEQLRPADPAWNFKTIPRPSKSDLAAGANVTLAGNVFDPDGADGSALVNGVLPTDSLDLSEEALLNNRNADGGNLVIDLGRVQRVAVVASYSWHEWDVDQGSRGPQVYTLYGSAAEHPDLLSPANWTKIADVDTRPNSTGANWNGQHGVFVTDTTGRLGEFRYLLFALQRTRSPLQPNVNLTGTLFSEIDVHSEATLARAGDAVAPAPSKVEHIWVVFKTHLDIGYTDRIEAVLKKYRENMMDGALNVIDASRDLPPEQRFSWTLAGWPLMHVLGPRQEPSRRARIEQAVREDSITFHALPFTYHTETDDLEDLVRGLGYSSQLARRFEKPLPISAKMTDVPCHSWVWPTLLQHAGIKFLQIGCNNASAFVRVPPLFWWEGPDGSRILCNYTTDYGSGIRPPRNWPAKHYLAMIMTGDNNGPPTVADVERLRQEVAKTLPGVQVHIGTLDDFARAVLAENPDLPIVRADMPDTWIHGWQSMPIEAKLAHNLRPLEPAVDALDTQLRAWGLTTGGLAPALADAYEQSDLFSEHTFGPAAPNMGSWNSGTPRYLYGEAWKEAHARGAYLKYEEAFDEKRAFARRADQIVRRELTQRLDLLARSVKVEGDRVVVFNALPWKRSGVVELPGQPGRRLFAKDIPAGGYRTFRLNEAEEAPQPVQDPPDQLETAFFKVVFDLKRGGISSLVDRRSERELVDKASPYALGQFLHERFDDKQMLAFHNAYGRIWYSWVKGDLPKDTAYAALTPPSWRLATRRGSVADVATLTATDTLGLAKGISIVFTLPKHHPYVEVEWRVTEKTPDPIPEGGWLCFPFAVAEPKYRLGRLGGPIDPTKDIVPGANRHYFCLNTGLTIADRTGTGVGLCPMDSPCVSLGESGLWKFSLGYLPKRPTVFVNLYNNEWNTNFPEWQDGSWTSRVRLWLTGGDSLADDLIVPSWEARLPLLVASASGSGGKLAKQQDGLRLSRTGVLVTAFGQNPDGPGLLLRLWEQAGQTGSCKVRLPAGLEVKSAQPVNLRGESDGPVVPVRHGELNVALRGFAPVSFMLKR